MRRLRALLAAGVLAAGALAIASTLGGGEEPSAGRAQRGGAAVQAPTVARALDRIRRATERGAREEEATAVRQVAGDPRAERDHVARDRTTFAPERAAAEPIARRFFAAFAQYELGEASERVARRLLATAAPGFAEDLLEAPAPRILPGVSAPERARLKALELVPGESAGGRLVSLEFVATVARGGDRTPLAITLRRSGGSWLVTALGR